MLDFDRFSQANNAVIRTWGERRLEGKLKNHVDLVKLLDIVDLEKGILLFGVFFAIVIVCYYLVYMCGQEH